MKNLCDTDLVLTNTLVGNIYDCNFPGCMTTGSCYDKTNEVDNKDFILPYPFSKLKIERDLSSHGKSWLFHYDEICILKGYLFPYGYRLYGNKTDLTKSDMFLIENRNILKFHYGLLGAIVPFSPIVGINNCQIVLFQNINVKHPKGIFVTYFTLKKNLEQSFNQ